MTGLRPCLLAIGVLALSLAGCHAPSPKGGAASAESHAPGTTLAAVPAACGAYPPGSPGVVRSFCSGPAVVDHVLRGGSCSNAGGVFSLNLGIEAGPALAGPRPDYIGLTVNAPSGPFTDAVLSVHYAGKAYLLTHNSGQIGPAGGDFAGSGRHGRPRISGSFTC
jgi:hypothetical protein